ncbi:hypothetical protein FEM48_Zijuj11G0108200 [Ziziphus jujuba var. spinosa]|uniref:Yippee domain-containing protein n=1 Tax=Ziziphus jujuba var. spinosa TaxID=714518 RepID=A0A978UII4_ZIZJJ|nr:hypothetical protein FEM48_Zijuj11G0108200 [Ziziphus jujuba var. spinosa]
MRMSGRHSNPVFFLCSSLFTADMERLIYLIKFLILVALSESNKGSVEILHCINMRFVEREFGFLCRDKILYYLFPHGDQSYFLHIFQGHAYPASETCSYYYSQEHDLQMDASDNTHFVFLIRGSVNITVGEKEERMMITGMHTVVDIFCVGCGAIVGWKYEAAHEKTQKYKEGKFILERFKLVGPDGSNYFASLEAQVGGSDPDDA